MLSKIIAFFRGLFPKKDNPPQPKPEPITIPKQETRASNPMVKCKVCHTNSAKEVCEECEIWAV